MYGELIAVPTLSGQLSIPTQGVAVLIDKTITDNGVYHAIDDNADGYKDVTVALPLGIKAISANGSYNASSDELKGYSSVSVNVQPTLGEKTITTNGIFYASDDNVQGYSKIITEVHGQGVVIITQSDYDDLSQAEKTNGSAYYIAEVSNALDMTGASITRQGSMSATIGNGSVSWTMGSGTQIGLCINKAIDVTNVESIIYDMEITAFYGGGAYINHDSRRTSIYVGNTGITNYTMYPTQPQVLLEYVKVASYPNQRLDVSQLTGTMYFNLNLGGSTGTITNLRLCTNDGKIMYLDNKFLKQL